MWSARAIYQRGRLQRSSNLPKTQSSSGGCLFFGVDCDMAKKKHISPEFDTLLDREQVRMFRERPPIKPALWMSEITVSTVFGPNSDFHRSSDQKSPV